MTSCVLDWCLVLLFLPIVVLLWATESRSTRIKRLRRNGTTWTEIASRYGVSPSTVMRWAVAKKRFWLDILSCDAFFHAALMAMLPGIGC